MSLIDLIFVIADLFSWIVAGIDNCGFIQSIWKFSEGIISIVAVPFNFFMYVIVWWFLILFSVLYTGLDAIDLHMIEPFIVFSGRFKVLGFQFCVGIWRRSLKKELVIIRIYFSFFFFFCFSFFLSQADVQKIDRRMTVLLFIIRCRCKYGFQDLQYRFNGLGYSCSFFTYWLGFLCYLSMLV